MSWAPSSYYWPEINLYKVVSRGVKLGQIWFGLFWVRVNFRFGRSVIFRVSANWVVSGLGSILFCYCLPWLCDSCWVSFLAYSNVFGKGLVVVVIIPGFRLEMVRFNLGFIIIPANLIGVMTELFRVTSHHYPLFSGFWCQVGFKNLQILGSIYV